MMTKSARGFLWDNLLSMSAYWALAGTAVSSVCAYWDISLPVSNILVGLTGTLPIAQLAGSLFYARTRHPRRFVLGVNLLWRCFLPLAFLTVLLPAGGGLLFGVLYPLAVLLYQLAIPVQNSWMAMHVSSGAPKDYYALREMSFMLAYSVAFCGVNLLLARGQAGGTLGTSYVQIGLLMSVPLAASLAALWLLPREMPAAQKNRPAAALRTVWQNRDFRAVLLLNMGFSFCSVLVGSYATLYQVQVLKVNFLTLMICALAGNLLRAWATMLAGRAAAVRGWSPVLCAGMLVFAAAGCVWLHMNDANRLWAYPLVSVLGGLPYAATGIGFLQLQIETTPNADRSNYFAVVAACTGIAALAGTSVCSAMIGAAQKLGVELRWLFLPGIICLIACALAALALRPGWKPARRAGNETADAGK